MGRKEKIRGWRYPSEHVNMGTVSVSKGKPNGSVGDEVNEVGAFMKVGKVGNRLQGQRKSGSKLGGNNIGPRNQSSGKLSWKKRAREEVNFSQNLQHVPTILGSRKGGELAEQGNEEENRYKRSKWLETAKKDEEKTAVAEIQPRREP
jgi:hypothetical protein